MVTIAEAFSLAWNHHQAGNFFQAEPLYRQILAADPTHSDSLHCLGVLAYQTGRPDEALSLINQALRVRPTFPAAHYALGIIHSDQGKLDEAVAHYRSALHLSPNYPEALNNLANVLLSQGKTEEVVILWQELIRMQPNSAAAHCNLANALVQLGKLDEAVAHCQTALRLHPNLAEAYVNLANAQAAKGHPVQATASFRQALHASPQLVLVHNNFGNFLVKQDKLDEAIVCYQQAVRLNPGSAENHNNLGNVRFLQGLFDQAQAAYDEALRHKAGDPDAHFNQAMLWLLQGKWEKGWHEYEWRCQTKGFPRVELNRPCWDGRPAPPAGGTILLLVEQGLGDTLQFVRYIPLIKERGWKTILFCQPPLLQLLVGQPFQADGKRQAGKPDVRVVTLGEPLPPFDAYLPLLSLPAIFGTLPTNVPATIPYLQADPALVEHWRRELQSLNGLKVGIAWQGSPTYRSDRQRSIPLPYFARLAQVKGVQLISLQKGPGTDQLKEWQAGSVSDRNSTAVLDLGVRLDETSGPFMDTAAIMKSLDLVISSDTAVPHLAGALGVPVWVALPLVPDWRWLLEREDSPWYPTMRLFRQKQAGNWDDVFNSIAAELNSAVFPRD